MTNETGRLLAAAALTLAISTPASAQVELPEQHRKWLEEEVVYIISDVERETFLELESEEERSAFIAAFWRKRDTNPNTLENEYKEEHYERIQYANEFLGRDSFLPGWQTDRGRYYILLGPPATREDFTYSGFVYPAELWFYQNPELMRYGLPSFFYLLFFKRGETGPFRLYDHVSDGPGALLTGYQEFVQGDFRQNIYRAYDKLYEVSPELAHASLSFRTDEGNVASDVSPIGTIALLDDIREVPFVGVDTSYAERFGEERALVESDYLFSYVPSYGVMHVLPGPGAYYLHWALELEPQHVAVVRDADTNRYGSLFDVSMEIAPHDEQDVIVLERRSESFLALDETEAEQSLSRPLSVQRDDPAPSGKLRRADHPAQQCLPRALRQRRLPEVLYALRCLRRRSRGPVRPTDPDGYGAGARHRSTVLEACVPFLSLRCAEARPEPSRDLRGR